MITVLILFINICAGGALMFGWSFLYRKCHEAPPLWLNVIYFLLAFGVMVYVGWGLPLSYHLFSEEDGESVTGVHSLAYLIFPLVIWGIVMGYIIWDMLGIIGGYVAAAIFESHLKRSQQQSYGKARTKVLQGDIIDGIREYRRYFEADPSNPAPLFEAAQMLRRYDSPRQAAAIYMEIMNLFRKKKVIWAEAAYQLAEVYERELQEKEKAFTLRHRILRDAGKTPLARRVALEFISSSEE